MRKALVSPYYVGIPLKSVLSPRRTHDPDLRFILYQHDYVWPPDPQLLHINSQGVACTRTRENVCRHWRKAMRPRVHILPLTFFGITFCEWHIEERICAALLLLNRLDVQKCSKNVQSSGYGGFWIARLKLELIYIAPRRLQVGSRLSVH